MREKIFYIHNIKDFFKGKKKCEECRGWWEGRELTLCEMVHDLQWENKWLKKELGIDKEDN